MCHEVVPGISWILLILMAQSTKNMNHRGVTKEYKNKQLFKLQQKLLQRGLNSVIAFSMSRASV